MPQPTASIITLGCRLNQADSAYIAEQLHRLGFRMGGSGESAALIVVNSCTVTGEAGRKSRQAVRAARRRCPDSFVVVVGCDAQADRQAWADEASVDLVLDNVEKHRLIDYLPPSLGAATENCEMCESSQFVGRLSESTRLDSPISQFPIGSVRGELSVPEHRSKATGAPGEKLSVGYYPHRTRANLKVQEGCDYFCSFCVVPFVRGKPRSRPVRTVVDEARVLLDRGHRELVLTGVNLGLYNDRGRDLPDLLAELVDLGGDYRLRLSSIEPGPVIDPLIEIIREQPRICRFLHMPLQYGQDRILSSMNRRYTAEEYKALAQQATSAVPGLCLGTDIMVGFPGETEQDFDTCLETVDHLPFGNLHVFRFSPRPGTPAASFAEPVAASVAGRRYRRMRQLGIGKERDFALAQIGSRLQVLIEDTASNNNGSGWSDNYLRVGLGMLPESMQGEFAYATITEAGIGRRVTGKIKK